MATLTMEEFERCLDLLGASDSPGRLRDRLAKMGAFHSRRGLNSARAIADRLYRLSGGLRRESPASRAFQALWTERIGAQLDEEAGRELDGLADAINALLEPDGSVRAGAQQDLERAVATYEEALARRVGGEAARLDTLLKALPAVAEILRSRPVLEIQAGSSAGGEEVGQTAERSPERGAGPNDRSGG